MKHAQGCRAQAEAHVVYDHKTETYRPVVRCACGLLMRKGRRAYPKFAEADEASRRMPLTFIPRPPKLEVAVFIPPSPPPTPQEINAAWIGYWRTIMRGVGHESRL